eukprot:1853417-Rhodomonas_salina.5
MSQHARRYPSRTPNHPPTSTADHPATAQLCSPRADLLMPSLSLGSPAVTSGVPASSTPPSLLRHQSPSTPIPPLPSPEGPLPPGVVVRSPSFSRARLLVLAPAATTQTALGSRAMKLSTRALTVETRALFA